MNYDHERGKEASAASEKALSKQPRHPDFIWLRADSLRRQTQHQEAIDFVDKNLANVEHPAHLLVAKAAALHSLSFGRKADPKKAEAAFVTFEAARKADPSNVNAHYLPGIYLTEKRNSAEGCPLLRKAIALSPSSERIHSAYWRCINGLADLSLQEKRAQIEADIKELLTRSGSHPGALIMVASQYGELKLPTKQKQFEDQVLQNAPDSKQAEWVLVDRYRRFQEDASPEQQKDPNHKVAYRRMLRDFINRPHHHQKNLLGDAYRSLFFSIARDTSVKASELLDVINNTVKYDRVNVVIGFGQGAVALAERKVFFREAEALARAGIVEGKKKIESPTRIL